MARILYISPSHIESLINGPFHEQFINSLKKNGNSILLMRVNDFTEYYKGSNNLRGDISYRNLKKKIQNFDPDIVFSFNNTMCGDIIFKHLTCPIMVFGADSPPTWIDTNSIKNNASRCHVLHFSKSTINLAKDIGINNNHVIGYASDMEPEEKRKKYNISFIGTRFSSQRVEYFYQRNNIHKNQKLYEVLKKMEEKLDPKVQFSGLRYIDLMAFFSASTRNYIINSVADLGLGLFGSKDWISNSNCSYHMLKSYKGDNVITMQDNQNVYNQSKISINISHVQSDTDNMPFRVCDIMSTNSVLVSDEKTIYDELFGKFVKIPTYSNQFEARDICKKLLNDEKWRKDIVEGSNLAMREGNFRFKDMIDRVSQISGVSLSAPLDGKYSFLNPYSLIQFNIKAISSMYAASLLSSCVSVLPEKHSKALKDYVVKKNIKRFLPLALIDLDRSDDLQKLYLRGDAQELAVEKIK
ncbi:MAG: hypothetical protein K0T99_02525 [Alphaproteobacteria bacterium]|nr:hypothetical protein [Alphaproteobacteria bacterium]